MNADAKAILDFWFGELGPKDWFATSAEIDGRIRARFGALLDAMSRSDADHAPWLATAEGSLALVILLDQFPRNIHRGTARAFAADAIARDVARQAIQRGHDLATPVARRVFYYLPLEHSERLADQEEAVRLVRERANLADYLHYAELHRDIIRRFGRFPHRNAVLGRESTAEEADWLANGGPTFGTTVAKEK